MISDLTPFSPHRWTAADDQGDGRQGWPASDSAGGRGRRWLSWHRQGHLHQDFRWPGKVADQIFVGRFVHFSLIFIIYIFLYHVLYFVRIFFCILIPVYFISTLVVVVVVLYLLLSFIFNRFILRPVCPRVFRQGSWYLTFPRHHFSLRFALSVRCIFLPPTPSAHPGFPRF